MKTINISAGRYWFYFFLIFAIVIKFSLFFYILTNTPRAFLMEDSPIYLTAANSFLDFIIHPQHGLTHSQYPMPGYPLILTVCLYALGLSIYQIVLIQIILNLFTAFIVSRIARSINPDWGPLSALIVLLDLPLTVYSQTILTEAFFIFAVSCFIYCFNRYLLIPSLRRLVLAALTLVFCVYIRPIACYLPWPVAFFIVFLGTTGHWKRNLCHACLLIIIFMGLTIPWQYRNYKRYGDIRLSTISVSTIDGHSFFKESAAKKILIAPKMPNYVFYPYAFSRNVLELLTTPGRTSYFHSRVWFIFARFLVICSLCSGPRGS